jgi:hypothetical protein
MSGLTESDLLQFIGTTQWYRHPLVRAVTYTDGAHYVAEHGGAYWLIDIIATTQLDRAVRKQPFQVWKLTVKADRTGTVTCDDGNGKQVYRQELEFTDFPLPEISFYFTDNVIMLPTEY